MPEPVNENMHELVDSELSEVAGGWTGKDLDHDSNYDKIYCYQSWYCGYSVAWENRILYCPCPKCRTPMRKISFMKQWFCTRCQTFGGEHPRHDEWNGYERDLIFAVGWKTPWDEGGIDRDS